MPLLSVRMRASLGGKHVSGAERIVDEKDLERTVLGLLGRPKDYDEIVITVEVLKEVETVNLSLPVSTHIFERVEEAREFAVKVLSEAGVPEKVGRKAVRLLAEGPSPSGGVMRGAVLMDIKTGERLESDKERGVRTVRVDWESRDRVREELLRKGFTERTLDALAIATKNVLCGALAELCWSDDPDYLTGYVASPRTGYVRIHPLKERGDPMGGRVYFIRRESVEEFTRCVEKKAILLRGSPSFL